MKHRSGQVMILTVLALGGTLLGATTVAGLLTLYQIRNSTDLENSAKAIFAADAGIEWGLYNFGCTGVLTGGTAKNPCPMTAINAFDNGASVKVVCADSTGTQKDCNDPDVSSVRSIGAAAGSSRAFEASF